MSQFYSLIKTIMFLPILVSNSVLAQVYEDGGSKLIDPPNITISEVYYDRSFDVTWPRASCDNNFSTVKQYVRTELTLNVFDQEGNMVVSEILCGKTSYTLEDFPGGVYSVSAKIDFEEKYEEDCSDDDGGCSYSTYTKYSEFSEPQFVFVPDIDFIESQNQTYGCKVTSAAAAGDECRVAPQWSFGAETSVTNISAMYPTRQSGSAQVSLAATTQAYGPSLKSSGNDLFLNIARPNSGTFVSWNKLSSIALKGNVLKILNISSLNSNLSSSGEVSQIVLDLSAFSSNILLDGEIQVIGKPADLIILFADKSLSCSGCSIMGAPRVLLSSGIESSVTYTSAGLINTIETGKGSIKVDSNGLKAEGLAFVDLAAKDIQLDGDISLNVKVDVNGSDLKINPEGSKSAASGFLRIYLGEFTYKYDNGEISLPNASTVSRFYQSETSEINAGNIFIDSKSALGSFWVNGVMSTEADFVMANFYQGEAVIPEQKIHLDSIVDIHMQGHLSSNGETTVVTGSDLIIETLDNDHNAFDVHGLNLVAVGRIANYASLVGEKILMTANEILNEGDIESKTELQMNGVLGVYNQFGGFILADQIDMNSLEGFVVNGSLRPYKYGMVESNGCAAGATCKPGFSFSSTYEDLSSDPAGLVPLLVTNLSATILGNNIDIETKRFQNVNPYYVFNKEQVIDPNGIQLDVSLGDQVVISALQNLTITANGHILNSSAIAEAVSGELALNSSVVTNERYRIRVGTKPGSDLPENFCELYNDCILAENESITTTTTQQVLEYYSPAGRFYSGGRALINASFSFINDLSYFEIHGDLDLLVNHVLQIGLDINHTATVNRTTSHSKRYCKTRILGSCVDRATKYWTTSEEYVRGLDRESIPALFAVEGYLFGEGADKFQVTTVISQ